MVAPHSPSSSSSSSASSGSGSTGGRMTAVRGMTRLQRELFELERAFVASATTLVPRVGEPELKYLICHHVWENASHGRFLRERGRELSGFGNDDDIRPELWRVFVEAAVAPSPEAALAGFYRVLKPHLLSAYRHYLEATHRLADWPSRRLVEEFIGDEERHATEMEPWLQHSDEISDWCDHLRTALGAITQSPKIPATFAWRQESHPYRHPETCNRSPYPICSSVFEQTADDVAPIVRDWLEDPKTDARIIRIMIYVWLMMELDAVDYLSTVFIETANAPFDLHHDLARHLWDESRHSQFGFRQLPKHGVDLMTVEHSLDLYHILLRMPPAERYAMMTMEFEAGSFATKAHIMDRVRELNDFEADTLLAFDRNDEQNHVRYGHRWLPVIMKVCGHDEPVEEFVTRTKQRFAELAKVHGGKTPHTLAPAERFTAAKIRAMYS